MTRTPNQETKDPITQAKTKPVCVLQRATTQDVRAASASHLENETKTTRIAAQTPFVACSHMAKKTAMRLAPVARFLSRPKSTTDLLHQNRSDVVHLPKQESTANTSPCEWIGMIGQPLWDGETTPGDEARQGHSTTNVKPVFVVVGIFAFGFLIQDVSHPSRRLLSLASTRSIRLETHACDPSRKRRPGLFSAPTARVGFVRPSRRQVTTLHL